MVLRAREVLEHVAVALGRHDAEVEAESVVSDDGRLRVATREHLGHPVAGTERRDERGGVARRRDDVGVLHRLPSPANAARLRDGERRRVSGESVDHPSHRRKRPREQVPFLGSVADAGLERLQDLLLAPCAHPGELPEPALLRRGLQAVERRDAELHPDARCRLRADTRAGAGSRRPRRERARGVSSARASRRPRRPRRPCSRSSCRSRGAPSPCRRARAPRSAAATPGSGPRPSGRRSP